MRNLNLIILFFICFISNLNAQEIPEVGYPPTTVAPEPPEISDVKTTPIFPGCELSGEDNYEKNMCFRKIISTQITERLLERQDAMDSIGVESMQTIIKMKISKSGTIEEISAEGNIRRFNQIVLEEMNQIAFGIKGIIPAKQEDDSPVDYWYRIPIKFMYAE